MFSLIVILILLALAFPVLAIIALVVAIDMRGAVRRLEQRVLDARAPCPARPHPCPQRTRGTAPSPNLRRQQSQRPRNLLRLPRHRRRRHVRPDHASTAFLAAAATDRP